MVRRNSSRALASRYAVMSRSPMAESVRPSPTAASFGVTNNAPSQVAMSSAGDATTGTKRPNVSPTTSREASRPITRPATTAATPRGRRTRYFIRLASSSPPRPKAGCHPPSRYAVLPATPKVPLRRGTWVRNSTRTSLPASAWPRACQGPSVSRRSPANAIRMSAASNPLG